MAPIRHPLEQAARKRELARTIRRTALTIPRAFSERGSSAKPRGWKRKRRA